jgi:hypothetical protein
MAKEDEILRDFMAHPLLQDTYGIDANDLPGTIEEGLKSNIPIILAITTIVKGVQRRPITSDNDLQRQVITILNNSPL